MSGAIDDAHACRDSWCLADRRAAVGRVYISDASAKRVLRVERDGSALTPITRSGAGLGEVMRPTSLALIGDSVLAVQDGGQRRVVLFDRASMQPRGSIAMGWPSTGCWPA